MNAIDLFEDAETTNLTLTRVANFYNGTVRVLMKAMHGHCLISYQDLSDGNLRLNRKSCERPISEEPLFPDDTPDNVRMASTCFSWCCDAIVAGTGILALFAQGLPITVAEINFRHVVPKRKIYVGDDGEKTTVNDEASHHVIKLMKGRTPVQYRRIDEHGLIGDPTYEQFGYDVGVDDFDSYEERISDRYDQAISQEPMGSQYKRHLERMEEDDAESLIVEAACRTAQNTVYGEWKDLGVDLRALLTMDDDEFSAVQDRVLNALQVEMQKLRKTLDQRWLYPLEDHLDHIIRVVEDCDGEGHGLCEKIMNGFDKGE